MQKKIIKKVAKKIMLEDSAPLSRPVRRVFLSHAPT